MKPVKIIKNKITSHEGSLKNYIKEVNKYPLLTDNELVDVCNVIRNGNEIESKLATEKLIHSNLRFVISVAKQYMTNDIQFSDLINEGNIGLINAAKKYDISMNIKFLSYAVWWIRKYILLFLNEDKMIRIPQNRVLNQDKIRKFNEKFIQDNGFDASLQDIGKLDNISDDDINLYLTSINLKPISISSKLDASESETEISEFIPNEDSNLVDDAIEQEHSTYVIHQILKTLKPRNREIISDLFGIGIDEPLSHTEVGKKHNLHKERVRQIKEEILEMLRSKAEFLV